METRPRIGIVGDRNPEYKVFVPQVHSKPGAPHPLVAAFVAAAKS